MTSDWRQIPQMFEGHIWVFAGVRNSNYYRPTQMLVYLAMHGLFGFNPLAFHLLQVLMHAANGLLVYMLAAHLLKSANAALVAGALFAVHPIHCEAVDWVAAMPDVLLTLVMIAALLVFVRCAGVPRSRKVPALAALYLLALLTKEPGVMLLPVFLAYDYLCLGRPLREALRRNAILYATMTGVLGVYLLLRVHALGGLAPAQGLHHSLSGMVLALSIVSTLGEYLWLLAAPFHLSYFHAFEPTSSITFGLVASLVSEFAIIYAMLLMHKRRNGGALAAGFGLFLLLVTLAPALNVNGVGTNVVAERYLYLPSAGLAIALAVGWTWLARRHAAVANTLVFATVLASLSLVLPRNLEWHDDERLLQATVASSPRAWPPLEDLGTEYYLRGDYDAAIERYREAVKLAPSNAETRRSLGNAYERKGLHAEAIAELREAVALEPSNAEAHMSLGYALGDVGNIEEAIAEDQRALELRREYPEALSNLATMRMRRGDFRTAVALFRRSLALDPSSFETQFSLGGALANTDSTQQAEEALQKALEIAPNHPRAFEVLSDLAMLRARKQDVAGAIDLLRRSLALHPNSFETQFNLGMAYSATRNFPKAAEAFQKAIEAAPDHPDVFQARFQLGLSDVEMDLMAEAVREFEAVLALKPDFTPAGEALKRIKSPTK